MTYEVGLRSEWFHRKLRFNTSVFTTTYTDIQLRQLTIVDGIETNLVENAARAESAAPRSSLRRCQSIG